jgi:hypothetical protein
MLSSRLTTIAGVWLAMLLVSASSFATVPAPTIAVSLTAPAVAISQTTQSSFTATGRVANPAALAAVRWLNQFGQRGSGTWSGPGQAATWSANIPLRLGLNQLAVTVVDVDNHSATLHFAIFRIAAPDTGSKPQPAPQIHPPSAAKAAAGEVQPPGVTTGQTSQLWPAVSGIYTIPYTITLQSGVNATPAALSTAITQFNNTFNAFMQLQLIPSGNPPANYLNISVYSGGGGEGTSNVGMIGGEQTIDCGSDCDTQTWLHEFGHTVGLYHEHQRPDSANFITLTLANSDLPNYLNLVPLDAPNALNLPPLNVVNQPIGLYDYASVMHYSSFIFSKAGLPVLESIPAGIPLSNPTGYSAGDIDSIYRLYGAAPSEVTITTDPAGLSFTVDGQTFTGPHAFAFALNSKHTLSLPADPQVTNPVDGSTYVFASWNDYGSRTHDITIQGGSGALNDPAGSPAVTMYEANFIRLQPFAIVAAYPSSTAGTASASPAPLSEYGGTFYVDRTLVQLTAAPTADYQFADWFGLASPTGTNPYRFYITAPTTGAQPVFAQTATQPVTIIGESITGPNTWNPGIKATVDGNPALLPESFYPLFGNTAWNAGLPHTIAIAQAQSPVTTNVYYNWNSWSDGGPIGGTPAHNITQPASGTQAISASVTPYYASYSLTNGACAGSVATSPAGTPYPTTPPLSEFLFYPDGASVTTTASPVSPLEFAGWSGSLTGMTNPAIIHDEFIPSAAFNVSSTPLTITSLNPPAAASSAAALNVTINGTGFVPTSAVNFNNALRSSTYVSANQLLVQLTAGDLATADVDTIVVVNGATTAGGYCSVSATADFTVSVTAPADGYPGILWQNSNGSVVEWYMDAGLVASSANLAAVPGGWSVYGTGDFGGTGAADILWRNTSTGDVVIWFVNGGAITSSANLGVIPMTWSIEGTGDFNGDGKTDILWRNSNGDTVIWFMNGGSIASSADLGVIPTNWSIAGSADFNGDGIPDILWRNSNGDTVIWFMSGSTITSSADLGVVPSTWSIADTGDFNGEGRSDIVWRNSNGDTVIWFMNGSTITASTDLGVVSNAWTIDGVRDYNGDGKSDILWRNSNGDAVLWFMNGGTITSTTDLGVVPTSWTIVGGPNRAF